MPKLQPIEFMGFKCERCGYGWIPRNHLFPPRCCPRCKSPFWDRKRKECTVEGILPSVSVTDESDHGLGDGGPGHAPAVGLS